MAQAPRMTLFAIRRLPRPSTILPQYSPPSFFSTETPSPPPSTETPPETESVPGYQGPNTPPWDKRLHLSDCSSDDTLPYATLPPMTSSSDDATLASPELHTLADQIINMKLRHVVQLTQLVQDHFGFTELEEVSESVEAPPPTEMEEQTAFELKLMSFDAKSKIKVIKEVRAMSGLGLKEAKEMVEGAPKVVKKDLKKEEAEELMAKLVGLGAVVEIQ